MHDDDTPTGAGGFVPDADAWARYGDLVHATTRALDAAGARAGATEVPQPATSPLSSAAPKLGQGYGARGWGDLCDLVAALRVGETTALAEVEGALDRATARDGRPARRRGARGRARAGRRPAPLDADGPAARGPLAGAPYARKDLFFRAGFGAECGAPLFKGQVANTTATVIERLDAAGGVDIGRLAMAELAMSPTGFNAHAAHPRNPWNPDHVTGGSSSGSAVAVAAGYVRMALGTDTGGSIRHPAAMSGITGLKPTANRVSRAGVWPLSWSLDCAGPLARSARDCGLILELISGPDPRDTTVAAPRFRMPDLSGDLSGVRIAVPVRYYFDTVTPDVARALDAAIGHAPRRRGTDRSASGAPDMATVNAMAHAVLAVEASAQLGAAFRDPDCTIGRQVRDRLEPGMFYSASAYATALRLRPAIRAAWLTRGDGRLRRGVPARDPPHRAHHRRDDRGRSRDHRRGDRRLTHTTRGINYLGLPGLALPCGRDADGPAHRVSARGPPR